MSRVTLLALGALLSASPTGGSGQQSRALVDALTGRIDVSRVAVLGDEGEAALGPSFTFDVSPDGRWLVSPLARRTEMLVFRRDGTLERSVGRAGQGPGEFRYVRHIVSGDSLVHIVDTRNARWTRLNPRDWSVVATAPFPADPTSVVALDDTALVITAVMRSPDNIGYPLHSIDGRGTLAASFGAEPNAAFRADYSFLSLRVLARGRDSATWTSHVSRYRLEKWGDDGRLRDVLERDVPWFRPYMAEVLPTPGTPPAPFVSDVHIDAGTGLLWIAIGVPDADWAKGLAKSVYDEGTGYQVSDWDQYLDTVIEVVDLDTGRVLGSRRIDPLIWAFGGRTYGASYFEAGGISPRVAIWGFGFTVERAPARGIDGAQPGDDEDPSSKEAPHR